MPQNVIVVQRRGQNGLATQPPVLDHMRFFDELPYELRECLRNANHKYSGYMALNFLRQGYSAELIAHSIRVQDYQVWVRDAADPKQFGLSSEGDERCRLRKATIRKRSARTSAR